jgi:exopolysaccharide production protein ExoZ
MNPSAPTRAWPSSHPTIKVLQAGRALAALAVVASHTTLPVESFVGAIPYRLSALMERGYLGVDFFFVLSGFIIYYTNHHLAAARGWARHYVVGRATRIYLPYWPIAITVALLYLLFPAMASNTYDWSWFATLTLVPLDAHSALGVSWTLTYELVFYAIAAVLFKTREPLVWGALWAVLIALWHVAGIPPTPTPDFRIFSLLLNPMDLEFIAGMFAAWIVIRSPVRGNLVFVLAGIACLIAFGADGFHRRNSYIFGLAIACFLIPVVRWEQSGRLRVAAPLVFVGNASYAIYLIHQPVLSLISRLIAWFDAGAMWPLAIGLNMAGAVAAGAIYHVGYEKPVLRLLKRVKLPGRPRIFARRAGAAS